MDTKMTGQGCDSSVQQLWMLDGYKGKELQAVVNLVCPL